MTAARVILALAAALLGVSGLGYLASQSVLARPTLAPATPNQQYVAAPAPAPAQDAVPAPAGQPVGVPQIDETWLLRTANAGGLPVPALRAYARAQLAAPVGCALGWTTLAGIGWIESQHGTIGGRILSDDGHSSEPILGPALNGRGDVAAIPATPESTTWHGNRRWDHAIGPMQFIPSTWAQWGADGDGDGTADPHDLDDAAHSAARYLCADGHDLTSGQGWADAVFSYNHAQSYVDAVHAAATEYAHRTS